MKKIAYTWNQLGLDIKKIAKQLKLNDWVAIYGLPRGGLIPAVMLSHQLNIPLILNPKDITNSTIVIDDISDSGKTLEELSKDWKRRNITPVIITLWIAKGTKYMPNMYIRVKERDSWVIYPWETSESTR